MAYYLPSLLFHADVHTNQLAPALLEAKALFVSLLVEYKIHIY